MAAESLDYQSAFNRGTQFMAEAKWKDALDIFVLLREQQITSSDLEANLGRTYSELGMHGPAVEHLAQAVQLNRFDFDHRQDLAAAQNRVPEGVGTQMAHPAEWGNRISSFVRPFEAFWLASLMILILFFSRLFRPFGARMKRVLVLGTVVLLVFGILGLAGRSMAVARKDLELRPTPLESSQVLQTIKSGTRLRIIRFSGDFAEVERSSSFRGWVNSTELARSPF